MIDEPRILWITGRHPPLEGGMAVSSGRQVRELRRRDLALDVIAFTHGESRLSPSLDHPDGGTDFHFSRIVRPAAAAQAAWHAVLEENRRRPYTHVVGFGAGRPGQVAVTFAAWLGIPSVVLVRGNDFDQDWFDPRRGFMVRESLDRADRIGAVSPDHCRRIEALFPGKDVRFTPNGVDDRLWELLPADERLREETRARAGSDGRAIVGLFGELKYKKGLKFWLGALRDADLLNKAALLIVGDRVDEEAEAVLGDPALAPPVLRLPPADGDALAGLYAACDWVCLPSLSEGMPNVLLESMAVGVPAIVSDAGAMAEMVSDGETGFVFPALDRGEAARVSAKALTLDPEQRARMGRLARERVRERFSLERETRELERLILGIGDGHGPG